MKMTKRQLRRIIKEAMVTIGTPFSSNPDPLEPFDLQKGSNIRAIRRVTVSEYMGQIGSRKTAKKGSMWVVDAVGSGSGPEDVIAYGPGYVQIVIPPYKLSSFELVKK